MSTKKSADLVLEGGGVKGLGLVGAISALEEHKFTFHRIAGTSAGAIVGSLTAAGLGSTAMKRMMQQIDYTKFRDKNLLDQVGLPGELVSLLVKKGVYEGNYLHTWLRGQLDKLGVRTFGDLRITDDWAQDLPPEQRYKLVVIASDVTRGELVRLPWDYRRYGLDPDRQLVADAVRASMSIPFFYKPAKLRRSWLLDGSYLSNFPISIFDRTGERDARWPTFGVKLSAKPEVNTAVNPVHSTLGLGRALLATMQEAHDRMHLEDPCVVRRTIFVDSASVKTTDFDITRAQQNKLFQTGHKAALQFLSSWSFEAYLRECHDGQMT